ncbi:MAG: hydrogenase maturation protease [Anaerolineales bacterium]|nr:MAG: hydrogenase maturation protease [Anaerolineales bacterium]
MNPTWTNQAMTNDTNVLILGLGNILLQDESVGITALQTLRDAYVWPNNVMLMDGGVMGLELLPYLENAVDVLIIDAVRSRNLPGALIRLTGEEIPVVIALKFSVHQVGFQETLFMAQLRGTMPRRLVLWGIEPESIGLGTMLTPAISAQVPALITAVMDELASWGIVPAPHKPIDTGQVAVSRMETLYQDNQPIT